ncbi:glycosyltransferase family 4 protein [Herbaspirillum rubrisubalbicans]|uniref:Glycosyl transferase family 1 n=1 Tax=Herbaspirillum rubrisubalbicans TaxID=80842 RepID=A0AAD0XFE4_9BURK|nr:glycosyltransferase family 4 protein [Herbaspirillum rubrisubalbicans]AYR23392.1 glycosyl transferase family 1 [Herbaspirillum rubrisubalbicans]
MNVLFVHQNFPGQFRHLAKHLASSSEHRVIALTMSETAAIDGVTCVKHQIHAPATQPHPHLQEFNTQVYRGQSTAQAALRLRKKGFIPDLIWAHPGWGEALFLKDVFPEAKMVCYQEFFYRADGSDVNFDPEYPCMGMEAQWHLRVRNSVHLHALEAADASYSPTYWQRNQYPSLYREKIAVLHDGIDTDLIKPDDGAWLELEQGRKLTAQDEVITFVNRNLEPYRGFHMFMRALPELLWRRPNAHVVIVGGDGVSYGAKLPSGTSYREKFLAELGGEIDRSRVSFLGQIPYGHYISLLQISACHVYLTYPFVLSWSLLESMSAGVPLLASATAPVKEVVEDGVNGLLVDFFSPQELVEKACTLLSNRELGRALGIQARQSVRERYDLQRVCLPEQLKLMRQVVEKQPRSRLPGESEYDLPSSQKLVLQ